MNLGNSDYSTLDSDHNENTFTSQSQKVKAILLNAFIKGDITEDQRIYNLNKYNSLLQIYNKTRQINKHLRELHQRGHEILKSINLDQESCDSGPTLSIPHTNSVTEHSENAQTVLTNSLEGKIKLLACYKRLQGYHDNYEKYSKTIKNLTTQREFLIHEIQKARAKRISAGNVRSAEREEKTQLTPQDNIDVGESEVEMKSSEDDAVGTSDILEGSDGGDTQVCEETDYTMQLIRKFDESVIQQQQKMDKLEQNVTFIRHKMAWYKDVMVSTIETVKMAKSTLERTKYEVHKLQCQRKEMTQRLTDTIKYFRNAQKAILESREKIVTLNTLVQQAKEEAFKQASQRLRVSEEVDRLKQELLLNDALPSSVTSDLLKYIYELHQTQARRWAMRCQLQEVLQKTGELMAMVDYRAKVHHSLATRQQQLNNEMKELNYRQLSLQTWVAVCERAFNEYVSQQEQKAAKWKERYYVMKAKMDYLQETKDQQEREYERLKERRRSAAAKCRALQSKLASLSELMKKSESKGSTTESEILSQSKRSFTISSCETKLQPYVQLDHLTDLCTELELVTHQEAGFELLFRTTYRFRTVGDENKSDEKAEKLQEKLSILERRVYQREAHLVELRLIYEYVHYITVKLMNVSAHHKEISQGTITAKNRLYNKLQIISRRTKIIKSEITVVKAKAQRLWQELQTRHEELKLVQWQLEQDRKPAAKKQRETMKNLSSLHSVHQSEDSPQHKFHTQNIKVFRGCKKSRKRKGVKQSKPFT